MTSWPVKTLDDLCHEGVVVLGRGNIISKKDIAANPGPYPIYSSARENEGKFGEYGDFMFDEEMITWSIDGGGRLFYRPRHKFSVTNVGGTLRILKPEVLETRYLHRALENLQSQKVFDWVFKAHPSVIRKVYDEIPVPPLEEQRRIAALLDDVTARITDLTACYEQARTQANNLFTSALRDAFESNPDWPVRALGDLLDVSIGGVWGSEAGKDDIDVFVYRSTELIKDGQLKEELTVRRSITMRQLQSRKLEEGDLLLEKSGGGPKTPVGRVGLVKVLSGLSVCSNFMQLMRPRRNDVLPVYLHYFLNYFHISGYTEDLQNNSTNIRNLKTTEYMQVEIPLPPLDEQKRIVARLNLIRAKTAEMDATYDAKLQAARNLRQSILEAAFAGEL